MAEKLISTEQFEKAVMKIMENTDRGVCETQETPVTPFFKTTRACNV